MIRAQLDDAHKIAIQGLALNTKMGYYEIGNGKKLTDLWVSVKRKHRSEPGKVFAGSPDEHLSDSGDRVYKETGRNIYYLLWTGSE